MLKLTRRQTLKTLFATTPIAAATNAFFIEPNRLSITRKNIYIKNLAPELDGFTIGQLSDLHYKPDKDYTLMEKVVTATNAEQLDFIAFTGDYITDDASVLPPLMEYLAMLNSNYGAAAVMGNHDGWTSSRTTFRRSFEKIGVPFLINQNTQININGVPLHIAGTDYIWLGNPDAHKTLKGIPKDSPVLALVHEPDYFDNMRSIRDIDLQLSGHTHGGQCRVPFIGYAPVKVRFGKKYISGHYQQANSQIYVSRGTGTSGIRVRFACTPELVVLTLRRQPE